MDIERKQDIDRILDDIFVYLIVTLGFTWSGGGFTSEYNTKHPINFSVDTTDMNIDDYRVTFRFVS